MTKREAYCIIIAFDTLESAETVAKGLDVAYRIAHLDSDAYDRIIRGEEK